MSAKKVRRHIRRLQQQRRRDARRQERDARKAVKLETRPQGRRPAKPERPRRERPRRTGAGVPVAAALVTAAVLASAGASLAADLTGEDDAVPAGVQPAAFPAADSGTTHVCPPVPGQPDSLTSDGLLDYRDRDDSVEARFQALVFDVDGSGSFPSSSWAELGEDGRLGQTDLTSGTADESDTQDLADPSDLTDLGDRQMTYQLEQSVSGSPLLDLAPVPEGPAGAAAAMMQYHADAGPVTGLGVAGCGTAQRTQWFFGPEVGAGSTALLTLANPFDRDATVTVSGVDGEGHREASGTRSLVVPGDSVRTVNIAAIAGSDSDLGVSVESSGAPVAAHLQSSRAVGLTGQGMDFLPGLAAPSTEHRMPAVPVPADTEDEPAAYPAELWIHAPGDTRATIEVQARGDDGQVPLENPAVFTVEPGQVDTVPLRGLDADIYDLTVRSDEPTFVAVSTHGVEGGDTGEDQALDFSWAWGATALQPGSGTLIPEIGETEIHVTAGQEEGSLSYRAIDADGEPAEVEELSVPAQGSVALSAEDLGDAVAVVITDADPGLHATVHTADEEGRFSLGPVDPLQDPDQSVPVRLRH